MKSRRMKWAEHVAHIGEEGIQDFDEKARRKAINKAKTHVER
jgi:hypothetical protein